MKTLLFARCFGIGNALMSVPAIKHYARCGFDVTVLVGTGPDDGGAYEVLSAVNWPTEYLRPTILKDSHTVVGRRWDVGVFSIPYDGRWVQLESSCGFVYDGRPRPDPSTFGFSSWEKHEAEYQLELAETLTGVPAKRELWGGPDPSIGHPAWPVEGANYAVYLGIGRKRDAAGFWEKKHWGDENYLELARMILAHDSRHNFELVSSGNRMDLLTTGKFLIQNLPKAAGPAGRGFGFAENGIQGTMNVMSRCHSFIGNDTGTMHLAAAMGLPIVSVFKFEGTRRKNHPLSDPLTWEVLEGHDRDVTPEEVYNAWKRVNRV